MICTYGTKDTIINIFVYFILLKFFVNDVVIAL